MPVYRTRRSAESYGQAIGILLIDVRLPFIPGDVANASTFAYPVVRDQVEGLCRYLLRPPLTRDRLTETSGASCSLRSVGRGATGRPPCWWTRWSCSSAWWPSCPRRAGRSSPTLSTQ
jgi:hypothetical protein